MWVPASGYKTRSGKSKWRVVWHDDPSDYRIGHARELYRRDGNIWICHSQAQAQTKANMLNKGLAK